MRLHCAQQDKFWLSGSQDSFVRRYSMEKPEEFEDFVTQVPAVSVYSVAVDAASSRVAVASE